MKRAGAVISALAMLFILAACGNWQVEMTEQTPAYENAIPEELALLAKKPKTDAERDEKYALEQTVESVMERTDVGYQKWVNSASVLRFIEALSLRPAQVGESAGVTVSYPFTITVKSVETGEPLVTYGFTGSEITVNGAKSVAQNPDAMQDNPLETFLTCSLFLLGEKLPFLPAEVESITVMEDEGFVYAAEPWVISGDSAATAAQIIADWVISDSCANPSTGGGTKYIFTLRDGREVTLSDVGVIWMEGVIGERVNAVGEKDLGEFRTLQVDEEAIGYSLVGEPLQNDDSTYVALAKEYRANGEATDFMEHFCLLLFSPEGNLWQVCQTPIPAYVMRGEGDYVINNLTGMYAREESYGFSFATRNDEFSFYRTERSRMDTFFTEMTGKEFSAFFHIGLFADIQEETAE